MGRLENMKSEYDNIPIPKELNARIQKEIEKSEKRLAQEKKVLRLRRRSWLRKANYHWQTRRLAAALQRHLPPLRFAEDTARFASSGHRREWLDVPTL